MALIRVEKRFSAPREQVWERYTDHESWSEWGGVPVQLERSGDEQRNGVGAVRAIGVGPIKLREEVIAFEPPERMVYTVISGGVGIRSHRGEVIVRERDQTVLLWRVHIEPLLPLTDMLLCPALEAVFHHLLRGLERDLAGAGA